VGAALLQLPAVIDRRYKKANGKPQEKPGGEDTAATETDRTQGPAVIDRRYRRAASFANRARGR